MLLYRNRLIFSVVKMIVVTVFQAVYGVVSFFKLQGAVIISLLWVILHFTGVIEKYAYLKLILSLALVLSVLYAVYAIIKSLLGLDRKKKKRRGAEVVKNKNRIEESAEDKAEVVEENVQRQVYKKQSQPIEQRTIQTVTEQSPKYFRVRQNPSLIMAEYEDRYELYKIADKGIIKIRTDFKQ